MTRPTLKASVGAGFVLLLVNSGYIAAFASATIFYMMNVLAHLVAGVALAVAFGVLLKREPALRRPLGVAAVLFAISVGFALYLVAVGNLREHRWALVAHVVTASLGVIATLPLAFGLARAVGRRQRGFGLSVPTAAVFAALLPLAVSIYVKAYRTPTTTSSIPPRHGRWTKKEAGRRRRSSHRQRRRTSEKSSRRTSSWIRRHAGSATRTSTSSGTAPRTASRRSITSSTASRSSTCRTSWGPSPASGARGVTTTRCSQRAVRAADQRAA
jgi:hypothetical protein